MAVSGPGQWGTWAELLLGGAVLRYGTRDWELVASELRSRIHCAYDFTPEVVFSLFPPRPPRLCDYVSFSFFLSLFFIISLAISQL